MQEFGPKLVQKQAFNHLELLLQCGQTLRDIHIGYETYGTLNESGDNAIFVAHHFSGNSHAAGRYSESDVEAGYWDSIIGPGKAIDSNKWFVISTDSLCNLNTQLSHVITTGPASMNPETGKPYGSSFPVVTIGDFVAVQKALCDSLGVRKLHAVAGPSMGSLQAMEWAAQFPEMVERVFCAIPAGLDIEPYLIATLDCWSAPIYLDRNFNGGDYYGQSLPIEGLTQSLKLVTLTALHYGWAQRMFGRRWQDENRDPLQSLKHGFAIQDSLEEVARTRAELADANSFLRLCRAVQLFSIVERKEKLRAKFLIMTAESDLLIFPAYAEKGIQELRALGLSVKTCELQGDGGHLDGIYEIARMSEPIRRFLETE